MKAKGKKLKTDKRESNKKVKMKKDLYLKKQNTKKVYQFKSNASLYRNLV